MQKKILKLTILVNVALLFFCGGVASCSKTEKEYKLQKEDIKVEAPADGWTAKVGQALKIEVRSLSDQGLSYQWLAEGKVIAQTKNLDYTFDQIGKYNVQLNVRQAQVTFDYNFVVQVVGGQVDPPDPSASAYITKVLDFMPAVGQYTNVLPLYEAGDTQATMKAKVLRSIGNNNKGMISLGGFGGYVVVGFDHTILNVAGQRDFRVAGNAFDSGINPDPNAPQGGSCEAGVIQVAYDVNKNGLPDDNEWYEIAGSAHQDPTKELWYAKALAAKNDVNTYFNYEITYYRPKQEPTTQNDKLTYIRWDDNQKHSGYKVKNPFYAQSYFPQWIAGDKITFKGTCLPQNGIDESGEGNYFVLYKFSYGYADNEINSKDESAIDIDWAVNDKGQKVHLPGVDFIKIYTGVNQEDGWLGECSTEITNIEDLHILGVNIATRK
ncbi:MAG: PKD-like domain-containing protein [Mucinivorans sp.]